jgi:hypothetical protein
LHPCRWRWLLHINLAGACTIRWYCNSCPSPLYRHLLPHPSPRWDLDATQVDKCLAALGHTQRKHREGPTWVLPCCTQSITKRYKTNTGKGLHRLSPVVLVAGEVYLREPARGETLQKGASEHANALLPQQGHSLARVFETIRPPPSKKRLRNGQLWSEKGAMPTRGSAPPRLAINSHAATPRLPREP